VNQSCDFWLKIGSCAVVLFLGLEDDTPSEVVIAILLIPLLWTLVSLAMYTWSRTAASVKTVRKRAALAQRVDDMTCIESNVGAIEFRKIRLRAP
jgi:hypothetical protein